jgi:hypothetical protein
MTTSGRICPHQKGKLAKYRWCTCSRWQNTLIPVVNSNGMTDIIVVTVPTENTHTHHHLSPQVAPMLLTLRG